MLKMALSTDDYEIADFVCEEIQKYNYPEYICKQVEEVIDHVKDIDSIKMNWQIL